MKSLNFLTKFFLQMLVVVILPIAIISVITNRILENYVYDEMIIQLQQDAEECESDLSQMTQSMYNLGYVFARDANFSNLLSQDELDKLEIKYYFDNMIDNVDNFSIDDSLNMNITVVDIDGTAYTNWSDNTHVLYDESLNSYIETAKANNGGFSWLIYEDDFTYINSETKQISLIFALYNPLYLNQYIGTMIISVTDSEILSLVESYTSEENSLAIVSQDGSLIYSNNEFANLENDEYFLNTILEIESGSIINYISNDYVITKTDFPAMWALDGNDIMIVNMIPENEIAIAFKEYSSTMNILYCIAIFVILAFAFLVIKKLLTPISILTTKISNYHGGEIVEGLDTKRNDEIGILNNAFVQMSKNISRLIVNIKKESDFKEKYHYEAMMAQLTPHFLFNTLNTIRWMALIRKADNIVHCTDSLSNMLKYSMNKEGEIVTIREEIIQVISYIDINTYRFGNKVQLDITIEEPVKELKVLKFLLQPIVENSIRHGFKEMTEEWRINISAYTENSNLYITVTDNGKGINEDIIKTLLSRRTDEINPPNTATGIGLNHINARIKYLYGENYGIDILSKENNFAMIIIAMPLIDGEGNVI